MNGQKIYCGDCERLPSAVYKRFGTRRECLEIGIGVGRKMEFDHLQVKLKKKGVKIRRSRKTSCRRTSRRRR